MKRTVVIGIAPFRRYCILAAFALVALAASCSRDTRRTEHPLSVIPAPSSMVTGSGYFTLKRMAPIVIRQDNEAVRSVADYLSARLGNHAGGVTAGGAGDMTERNPGVMLDASGGMDGLNVEGYELSVTEKGVHIRANTANGLFYGVQTLLQLMPPEVFGGSAPWPVDLPCVEISDVPRFRWRGMHLDVSRHYFPKEVVKDYIDYLAMHKMNVFHWHLVDGAGWRIEIKKYPRVTSVGAWRKDTTGEPWSFTNIWPAKEGEKEYGGYYTQNDVREIVAYASERFIEVVPEIEMPGHSSAALAAYPEYLCSNADSTNREYGNSGVFCAGNDGTFTFLEDILDEVIGLFPSEYVHIGGDEVPKRFWKACPECQARIRRERLKNEEELQSWFVRRMEKYLVSRGKKLIGWDEILEGGLAPEAVVMSWRGMKGGLEAARQNHDVVMTPEGSCYLNLYQGDPELEPVAWGGFLPLNKVYAFDPVPEELTPDEAKHIIGAQGCLWTEYIETPDMIEYMILPRLSAIAEVVWTDKALRDWDGFRERMIAQYARYDAMGVNYAKSAYNVSYGIDVDQTTFNATVVMRSDAAGTDIRYTLDGSDPTLSATLYTGPVELTTTAHIAAASFADGSLAGKTTSIVYNRHKAAGIKPVLEHSWYSGYPGQGEYTLTNCLMGSNNYADGQWQGFLGKDLTAVIDLGSETSIRRVTTTFFHSPGVWIFMPVEIEYSVSTDGVAYERVVYIDNSDDMRRTGPVIVDYPEDLNNIRGRFVRVRAKNIGVCPEWHAGAGGAAFLFADEIVIE